MRKVLTFLLTAGVAITLAAGCSRDGTSTTAARQQVIARLIV